MLLITVILKLHLTAFHKVLVIKPNNTVQLEVCVLFVSISTWISFIRSAYAVFQTVCKEY